MLILLELLVWWILRHGGQNLLLEILELDRKCLLSQRNFLILLLDIKQHSKHLILRDLLKISLIFLCLSLILKIDESGLYSPFRPTVSELLELLLQSPFLSHQDILILLGTNLTDYHVFIQHWLIFYLKLWERLNGTLSSNFFLHLLNRTF